MTIEQKLITFMTRQKAEELADKLNADEGTTIADGGWLYKVQTNNANRCYVAVYENNELVGTL